MPDFEKLVQIAIRPETRGVLAMLNYSEPAFTANKPKIIKVVVTVVDVS